MKRIAALITALLLMLTWGLVSAQPAQAKGVYCGGSYVIGFYNLKSDYPYATTCISQDAPRGVCVAVQPDNVTSYIDNETPVAWYIYGTANCTSTRTIIYGWEIVSAGTRYRDNWVGSTYRTSCLTHTC